MPILRLALCTVYLFIAGSVTAQTVIWHATGPGGGGLGGNAAILGDLDGDGRDDVACGDPNVTSILFHDGQIRVYSGKTGAVIHTINPATTFQGLGAGVDAAGDVDGDGTPDIISSSLGENPQVFSGATGLLMETMTYVQGSLPQIVRGLDDINGDGHDDVVVSDSWASVNGSSSTGRVQVVSGIYIANGVGPIFLHTWTGLAGGDRFGSSVDRIEDLDGDSVRDLIVAALHESGFEGSTPYHGVIHVYSGQTGVEIRTIPWFGAAGEMGGVSEAGDLDQDGFSDILNGYFLDDTNGTNSGRVKVYSGADGTTMYTMYGTEAGDMFGGSFSGAGDVGGDGFPDFLVGAVGADGTDGQPGGAVWVFSGKTGAPQDIIDLEGGSLGSAVAGPADFDGDARSDFVAGAPNFATDFGRVYAFSGDCVGDSYSYCTALPNSFAASGGSISSFGSTSIADQNLTLLARNCPPNKPGLFFYGTNQVQLSVGDGHLCTSHSIQRIYPVQTIDGIGLASLTLDWSSAPIGSGPNRILPGDTKNFSFWFRDSGPAGFNYTNARSMTFCP